MAAPSDGEPAPFVRTVALRTADVGGDTVASGVVDDHLHGFSVDLVVRDGRVVSGRAGAHRHPWTLCPGALASVTDLGAAGVNSDGAHRWLVDQPVDRTCVHVTDLVGLVAQRHVDRAYRVEVTRDLLVLGGTSVAELHWPLDRWTIAEGPFTGLLFRDRRWRERLDGVGADADQREAVHVARRALMVAMGYYELDWTTIERGPDVPLEIMAGTCHTFSGERTERAVSLVAPPSLGSRF